MIKDTWFIGYGADTYCIYYPQFDYAGKYNTVTFGNSISIIVDKPHNMYMGMTVGTGLISALAFIAILVLYAVQSIRLFWRKKYDSFIDYTGVGIFLGIMGFAATGMVDDSSVSVMPMFYGLLGTGVAINIMLHRRRQQQLEEEKRAEKVKARGGVTTGYVFRDDLFKTKTNI